MEGMCPLRDQPNNLSHSICNYNKREFKVHLQRDKTLEKISKIIGLRNFSVHYCMVQRNVSEDLTLHCTMAIQHICSMLKCI